MLWIFSLLYQFQIYDLSGKSYIEIEYDFKGVCNAYITFMKGYEIYKLNTQFKDKGLALLELEKAKLIPTRRKPTPIPLTIESECEGKVLNIRLY